MTRLKFARAAGVICTCLGMLLPALVGGQARIVLAGSGSSIAGPTLSVWENAFNREHADVQIAYVPTNSSEGIRQITLLRSDFALGEIPLTGEQMNSSVHLVQIPIAVVAVVPIYNVPGSRHLRFTGELLAADLYEEDYELERHADRKAGAACGRKRDALYIQGIPIPGQPGIQFLNRPRATPALGDHSNRQEHRHGGEGCVNSRRDWIRRAQFCGESWAGPGQLAESFRKICKSLDRQHRRRV